MICIKNSKPYEKYGIILGQMRRRAGLTQETAAEILDISTRVLQMYESGARVPRLDMAVKMAEFYSFSLDEFSGVTKQE